jgi:hypothetical protein
MTRAALCPKGAALVLGLVLAGFTLASTATGCGASEAQGDDENAETQLASEKSDALAAATWNTTASGSANGQVVHKTFGTAGNVVIAFGGYTAKTVYVERWVDELVRAKLAGEGFSEIYAVPGPINAGYNGELRASDQKIVSDLTAGLAANAKSIVVVAHSSGTYVANEFIGQVVAASKEAASKISYFVLDGGGASAANMAATSQTFFVWAHDGKNGMYSHNASGMQSLGATYKKYGGGEQVDATGAGCNPGATWCMHDGLITNHPHNPNMYDLADDYTDFTGTRAVQTSYLNGLGSCGESPKLVCAPVGGLLATDAGAGVGHGN